MEHFLQWAPVIAGAVPQRRHLRGCFVRLIQASGKCCACTSIQKILRTPKIPRIPRLPRPCLWCAICRAIGRAIFYGFSFVVAEVVEYMPFPGYL